MRILLGLALLAAPVAVSAQEAAAEPRTITINSTGTVEREPEQGVILLAVESEATTARAAAEANATRMAELMAALRQARVPERQIRTVSYELRPEYTRQERQTEPPRISGYRAINMVQVTVDTVARMGGVIDAAIGSGVNRVANISFQLRDSRSAHLEAVALAVANARREAEIIAQAAGERLGHALSITTGGYYAPPPSPPMYRQMDMAQAAAPTPIEGGTLAVTANVTIVFRLVD